MVLFLHKATKALSVHRTFLNAVKDEDIRDPIENRSVAIVLIMIIDYTWDCEFRLVKLRTFKST